MQQPSREMHNPLTWISGLFQWIGRYIAYLCEIFTAGFMLMMILVEVLYILLNHQYLFWGMFIVLLVFLAFIPAALSLGRDGLTNILMWEADPNRQSLVALQRERARLAFLRVKAQEENEKIYYWKHRRFVDPSEPLTISKYAGLYSFYYVNLSNYLDLPPETTIEPGSGESSLLPAPQTEPPEMPTNQRTGEGVLVPSLYAVLVMGGVRFRLRGKEVPIKSLRVRETLAFLAVPDHRKGLRKEEIAKEIQEEHALRKWEDEEGPLGEKDYETKAYNAYAYDVGVLGKLIEEACEEIGLPYVDPVKADMGNESIHRLAEEYVVEDLTRLEQLEEHLAARQQAAEPATDLEAFRKEYTAVLPLYGDGFLGRQLRKKSAPWAEEYFFRYQDQYHRLYWDLAAYEQALSQTQQGEERKASLRQAAKLYEECAFLTAPSRDDLEQGIYSPLSEQALRHCFSLYGLLGNQKNLHHTYHRYLKLLRRKSEEWLPDPQTVQAFEEATRSAREA